MRNNRLETFDMFELGSGTNLVLAHKFVQVTSTRNQRSDLFGLWFRRHL